MKPKYPVNVSISYSPNDEGYVAITPTCRCFGFGVTPEEALKEFMVAWSAFVEDFESLSRPGTL